MKLPYWIVEYLSLKNLTKYSNKYHHQYDCNNKKNPPKNKVFISLKQTKNAQEHYRPHLFSRSFVYILFLTKTKKYLYIFFFLHNENKIVHYSSEVMARWKTCANILMEEQAELWYWRKISYCEVYIID